MTMNLFSLVIYDHFLDKGSALHLNKLEFLSARDGLCQVWLNWPIGPGKGDKNVKRRQR